MAEIVRDVSGQLQSFERLHGLRRRARKPVDQRIFETTVVAVVCDLAHRYLMDPEGQVAVSLSHKILGKKSRYRSPALGSKLPEILENLATREMAFLELTKGGRSWTVDFDDGDGMEAVGKVVSSPSVMRAGPRLVSRLRDQGITLDDIRRCEDEEVIVLKARKEDHRDKGRYLDYDDTPETRRMREEVLEINGWIKEAELDAAAPEEGQGPVDLNQRRLRRVFNDGTFERGGRLFGGFWQNMKAERRRMDLLVAGEPGVELDYGQMALRLLYAKVGAEPPPGDLYDIPELTAQLWPGEPPPRDGIKKIINAALSSERSQSRVPQGARDLIPRRFRYLDLLGPIQRHHDAVVDHFFTGIGVELMRAESDLMVELLLDLKWQRIVALPIHDAVVVAEGDQERTMETMARVFRTKTGLEAVISVEVD